MLFISPTFLRTPVFSFAAFSAGQRSGHYESFPLIDQRFFSPLRAPNRNGNSLLEIGIRPSESKEGPPSYAPSMSWNRKNFSEEVVPPQSVCSSLDMPVHVTSFLGSTLMEAALKA